MCDKMQIDLDEQQIFKQYIQCIQRQDALNKQLPTLLESLKNSPSFQKLKLLLLDLQKVDLSTLSIHSESYQLRSKLQQLQQHVKQFFDSPSLNSQEFLQQLLVLLEMIQQVIAGYRKILVPDFHITKHKDFVSTLAHLQVNVQDYQEYQQKLLQFLQFLQNKQDGLQDSVKEYIQSNVSEDMYNRKHDHTKNEELGNENAELKPKNNLKEENDISQQFYETTRVNIDQNRQYSTNSNYSNPNQKSQVRKPSYGTSFKNRQYSTNPNYSNFNQKYQDLEEENRNLQRRNQELESKCKTLESECKAFESRFNDQKKGNE
ncbi:25650_t:CDS:2, partial [Gigaspora margarita]